MTKNNFSKVQKEQYITPYEELQEFVTKELEKNFNQESTYEQSDEALGE